eukprot:CAMPEP_0180789396 /NCGR_PEP_ID=MMETSP1038_2-20121128/52600_1 /TAXON_ID=632150 /ORGANISM="Azadinium spinosum, Strain 3D9" /LENGTH=123 /DNA_ID=CAMNT_0022827159 /DNA_START=264 /DNA_END=632 /DNA_ORIENTATION=+
MLIQPLVLAATALFAIDVALPRSLRFNLNQALLLDLLLMVVRAVYVLMPPAIITVCKSIGLGDEELYFCSQFFDAATFLAFVTSLSCIVYSLAKTTCGEVPNRIPYVSASAQERTEKSEDDFW